MTLSEKQVLPHILSLSKKLIAIPSTADNLNALEKVLDLVERELGEEFLIEKFEDNGSSSLLIQNTNKKTKQFKIILNAHLDVIFANKEQFQPFEKDGKLYARGAYDM